MTWEMKQLIVATKHQNGVFVSWLLKLLLRRLISKYYEVLGDDTTSRAAETGCRSQPTGGEPDW